MNARQIVRMVSERLHPEIGCTDGGCVFGHAGGMHTNGGCQCMKGRDIELRRNLMAMADVARALAATSLQGIEERIGKLELDLSSHRKIGG